MARERSHGEEAMAARERGKPLYRSLYFQVLVAIGIGVLLGYFFPETAAKMKPLGDGFIKLIKMMIAPIIFCTVVVGIAGMESMKTVGKTGGYAVLYFEALSTLALIVGLVIINVLQPGAGMNIDPASLDTKSVAQYAGPGKMQSTTEFLLNVIPTSVVDAFAKGDIMQVAPLGAFGAMAFTIGAYGVGTLVSLAKLMATFYATCIIFIAVVLGVIARLHGFSVWKFIKYIKEELFIVLGTSSSESVLPRMIAKLENLGVKKSVVGLVIPTGYSFNLDGTSIYLTMAAVFIAQATNTDMTLTQQLTLLGVLLLTSKGAAGVTGSGFIVLAATLSAGGPFSGGGVAFIFRI